MVCDTTDLMEGGGGEEGRMGSWAGGVLDDIDVNTDRYTKKLVKGWDELVTKKISQEPVGYSR